MYDFLFSEKQYLIKGKKIDGLKTAMNIYIYTRDQGYGTVTPSDHAYVSNDEQPLWEAMYSFFSTLGYRPKIGMVYYPKNKKGHVSDIELIDTFLEDNPHLHLKII